MGDLRTLRDKTLLVSLGLDEKDVKAINQKISMAKKLKEKFIEISDNSNIVAADILFVNAEKKSTMEYYEKCRPHLSAIPVFVYTNEALAAAEAEQAKLEAEVLESPKDQNAAENLIKAKERAEVLSLKKYSNAITIKKPITLSRLTEVLFNIITANESVPVRTANSLEEGEPLDDDTLVIHEKNYSTAKATFKALVVDDSFPVRKYLEKRLPILVNEIDSSLKIDIQFANSGKESVAKVTKANGDFDMVFLDIMMEDVNGYKVCKWIKKVKSTINVVMLTSKSSTIDRVRSKLSGCDDFISKPPKDEDLKRVLLAHGKIK